MIKVVASVGVPENAALLIPSDLTPEDRHRIAMRVDGGMAYGEALATVLGRRAALIRWNDNPGPSMSVDDGDG